METIAALKKHTLKHPSGATAEFYLYGAHITSFKDQTGEELLFLSKKSVLELDAPIRGGIPIMFPQFSDTGRLAKHGWARTSVWKLAYQASDYEVLLELNSTPKSLEDWPYNYKLALEIKIEYNDDLDDDLFKKNVAVLKLDLKITTEDKTAINWTGGFHPYIRIPESSSEIRISGLRKHGNTELSYLDNSKGREMVERDNVEDGVLRDIGKREVDRVYVDSSDVVVINDTVVIEKYGGFTNWTVWNPWQEKIKSIKDLEALDWKQYVCVEPVVFEPRGTVPFKGGMRLFKRGKVVEAS